MAGLEGTRLGDYELVELIGSGGMAEVYRARQLTAFGREVALKVIRPEFSKQQEFRERFLREAQAISRLSHPNILPLIEFREEGQTLYLVMPLVREGTLRDLIKQRNGPLAREEALPLFTQLCSAVHYAHAQGIIHRDIKPQNVLLQQHTHVLLADFGIARDRREKTITATGAGVGSAEYMAPEQAMGQADMRSDIYSLGIVLYQMLTGVVPYSGSTPLQVLVKHTTAPLPDPRTLAPSLPQGIVQVLQTALAKAPDERFQSAQALARAAQQALADASAQPRSSTPGWSQPSSQATPPAASAAFAPPASSRASGPTASYEQPGAASLPLSPLGSYETRPASNYGPMPSGNMQAFSQPGVGQASASAAPAFGSPTFSAAMFPPATQQPPAPVFPAPGVSKGPTPRNRQTRLIALGSVIALVVVLGGILLALGLTKSGPFAPGANRQATPTPTTVTIPAGFKLYTNKDQNFSIIYPGSWSAQPAVTVNGSGEQFSGPANQSVQVIHGGSTQPSDVGSSVDAFCLTFSLSTNGHTTATIAGQQWTREECDNPALGIHAIVEAIAYQGILYLLSYASPTGAFNSNR
ncbi:MAG TPA: serine/threonine-protein kinase, partial [Ktedonobacterales bacterium]|nr:serine/threonine-protein kinase [Ktedonobacterales bacterium]